LLESRLDAEARSIAKRVLRPDARETLRALAARRAPVFLR
jgi:hypothetical protein